jgi:drug/metabolite transporter (DMT)-like permease
VQSAHAPKPKLGTRDPPHDSEWREPHRFHILELMSQKQTSFPIAITAAAVTILSWASAYPAIRVGLRGFTPVELASLRFFTASIAFVVILAIKRPPLPRGNHLFRIGLAGALGIVIYNLALNAGELTVSPVTASFLINCMPVFAALLGVTFLAERLSPVGWFAIVLSFTGAAIIAFATPNGLHFGIGAILILLAALCASVMGTLQKTLLRTYPSVSITACLMFTGAVLLSPYLPEAIKVAAHGPREPLFAALFLGIFPAAIGYLAWTIALSRFTLNQTASLLNLVPVVTIAISYFWLHEIPAMSSFYGGILAIAGVILLSRYGRAPAGLLSGVR